MSALPAVGADHQEGLLEDLDEDVLGLEADIERAEERRERFLALVEDDRGGFGADRIADLDEDITDIEEELEEAREARSFIEGLDADLLHGADVDVLDAIEDLQDEIRDVGEDIERLEERRAVLEERRDEIPDDETRRRDRVEDRIDEIDEDIAVLEERRDRLETRLGTFTGLEFGDDPRRLGFAVSALDALPDVDRDIERLDDRIERVEERLDRLEERRAELDDDESLRAVFLETRIERVEDEFDELREERDRLEETRDALEEFDADAFDAEFAAAFGLDPGFGIADRDENGLFEDDVTGFETGVATGTSIEQESDLELDDVLNALALA